MTLEAAVEAAAEALRVEESVLPLRNSHDLTSSSSSIPSDSILRLLLADMAAFFFFGMMLGSEFALAALIASSCDKRSEKQQGVKWLSETTGP